MSDSVRPARAEDARAMGSIHVRAWQTAYRGAMPDGFLDSLVSSDRQAMWANQLGSARTDQAVLVVESEGAVAGFAVLGPEEMVESSTTGEVYAINIDPDSWHRGLGRALFDRSIVWLREQGYSEAVLWVLPGNQRAIRFYRAQGWTADGGVRTQDVLGTTVNEVRYRCTLQASAGAE